MVERDLEWMAVTSFNFEQNAAMPELSNPIYLTTVAARRKDQLIQLYPPINKSNYLYLRDYFVGMVLIFKAGWATARPQTMKSIISLLLCVTLTTFSFIHDLLIKASHSVITNLLSNGTLLSPSSVWSHPIDGCNRETPGPVVFIHHLKAFQYAKLFREFPSLFHLRQWRDVIWSDLKERLGSWWPFFTFSSSSPPLVKIDVEFKWQCHVPPPLAFILLFIPQTCYRKKYIFFFEQNW